MGSILLVGANSDIAKKTIEMLSDEASLILLTRDVRKLPEHFQAQYDCHSCDPCDFEALNQRFENISADKEISAVVNFCGSILLKPAGILTPSDWHQTMEINLTTAFHVAHAATHYIKKNCQLIFFSTAAVHLGLPNHEAIAAAKAGVEGLSKSVAATYAKQNIRSNVIAPGLIETHLSEKITSNERTKEVSLSLHALNRLGKPGDVASLLVWLLNPENNWITGEVFRVDGGLSTTKSYG